jgi:hypothetical protein
MVTDFDWAGAEAALGHVLWIGGGSEAGKSTIPERLATEYGFAYYHGDETYMKHLERAIKERAPSLWAQHQLMKEGRFFESFFDAGPEEKAQGGIESGVEDLTMAIEDILAMPTDRRIVADVFCAYAEGLVRVTDMSNLVFLVATDAFQREIIESSARERGQEPDQNYIEGQRLLSEYFRGEAKRLGIPMIVTGERLALDEAYTAVCHHFGLDRRTKSVKN